MIPLTAKPWMSLGFGMDWPWLLIALPICLAVFIVFEARALLHRDRQNTLSRFCYNTGRRWPISLYLAGMFTGILVVHLFAHFCPPGGNL